MIAPRWSWMEWWSPETCTGTKGIVQRGMRGEILEPRKVKSRGWRTADIGVFPLSTPSRITSDNLSAMVAACSLLSAFALLIAQTTPEATPSAAEIARRHVEAIGGAARWQSVRTLLIRGTNPILSYVWVWKAPDKLRTEERDETYTHNTLITAFDGSVGWRSNSFQGSGAPRRLQGDELGRWMSGLMVRSDLLDVPPGAELTVAGVEKIGGREAYKLSLRRPGRDEVLLWIDTHSFLLVQRARRLKTPWGEEKSMATPLGDYRNVQGLMIAHLIGETRCAVEVNPEISDALFQPPQPLP